MLRRERHTDKALLCSGFCFFKMLQTSGNFFRGCKINKVVLCELFLHVPDLFLCFLLNITKFKETCARNKMILPMCLCQRFHEHFERRSDLPSGAVRRTSHRSSKGVGFVSVCSANDHFLPQAKCKPGERGRKQEVSL